MTYSKAPEARLIVLNGKVVCLSHLLDSLPTSTTSTPSDRTKITRKARKDLEQIAGELHLLKAEMSKAELSGKCQSLIDELLQTIANLSLLTKVTITR